MTANKTASAISEGTRSPGEPSGSAVAKGHLGVGRGSAGEGATEGAYWFRQVLALYGDDSYVTRRRLEWEWRTGQWFLLLDDDGQLLGWISWYRCDFRTLAILRDQDLSRLVRHGMPEDLLTHGEYLYIASLASAAPLGSGQSDRNIVLALLSATRRLNPDATLIAGHSRRRGHFTVARFHSLISRHSDGC